MKIYAIVSVMWIDAEHLANFYRSKLGVLTARTVSTALELIWPSTRDEVVVGYGYTLPYLGLFEGDSERVLALMPAPQGALAWPRDKSNRVALIEEHLFPLPDRSVDKLLVIHALEYADHSSAILQECWRVLVEGGELLVVTPNRRGAWAQITTTPLGYGTPYTGHQLYEVLQKAGFAPQKPHYCLYTPPSKKCFALKFASTFEKYGNFFSKKFGGVLLMPAKKQVYAVRPQKVASFAPRTAAPV